MLADAVDWNDPIHCAGALWRKHFGTGYWVMVDPNGDLLHDEDIDWFLWHGWDLPPKPDTEEGATLLDLPVVGARYHHTPRKRFRHLHRQEKGKNHGDADAE